jgi:hypothetical protein
LVGIKKDDARFSPLITSGGDENVALYFPLCCWYIDGAGEPDRPLVIGNLNAEFTSHRKAPDYRQSKIYRQYAAKAAVVFRE